MSPGVAPTDPAWLALCYGGVLAAGAGALSKHLGIADARRAGRAAWCAACLAATLVCLLSLPSAGPVVDLPSAFAAAAWTAAATTWGGLARRPATTAAAWLAAVASVAVVGGVHRGLPIGSALAAAVALGGLVQRAMRRGDWLRFRLAAYWASFVGTFAVLIPLALSARDATPRQIPIAVAAPIAALALLAAVPLAVAATHAFAAAGGTPEPFDPPARLCRMGVYAYLRHPIQLAEILFVASGAAVLGTRAALWFLVVFACALTGPIRILEERALLARFGAGAADYRRSCPGFFPRATIRPAQ